jgi:hypothetical protein
MLISRWMLLMLLDADAADAGLATLMPTPKMLMMPMMLMIAVYCRDDWMIDGDFDADWMQHSG